MAGGAVAVLLVAAGAPWEPAALSALDAAAGVVVLRRCMDVTDLLAHAAAGDAQVAVLAGQAPGLDHDAVSRLRRDGVEPVVVVPDGHHDAPERVRRLGVRHAVPAEKVTSLPALVRVAAADLALAPATVRALDPADAPADAAVSAAPGASVAVWGPAGAPGRTTVALGITGELAARGRRPLLVDADPWGGSVAQRLAVLDEVSGLLAASRSVARGDDPVADPTVVRRVSGFDVVTGLPRADRWAEVGPEVVEAFLGSGREVVLDTGFSVEEDPASDFASRPGRNALTHAALAASTHLVVVGTPDPVGLARLARALDDLRELTSGQPVHVVLNRWRARLGIEEEEVQRLLHGFAEVTAFHFLPDDALAADRALVTGRTYLEAGPSPLSRAFGPLVDALFPAQRDDAPAPAPRLRLRRAAGVRRR